MDKGIVFVFAAFVVCISAFCLGCAAGCITYQMASVALAVSLAAGITGAIFSHGCE